MRCYEARDLKVPVYFNYAAYLERQASTCGLGQGPPWESVLFGARGRWRPVEHGVCARPHLHGCKIIFLHDFSGKCIKERTIRVK